MESIRIYYRNTDEYLIYIPDIGFYFYHLSKNNPILELVYCSETITNDNVNSFAYSRAFKNIFDMYNDNTYYWYPEYRTYKDKRKLIEVIKQCLCIVIHMNYDITSNEYKTSNCIKLFSFISKIDINESTVFDKK